MASLFPTQDAIHSQGGIKLQKDRESEVLEQWIPPTADRAREYPVFDAFEVLLNLLNPIIRGPFRCKRRVCGLPVVGIGIQVSAIDSQRELLAERSGARSRRSKYVNAMSQSISPFCNANGPACLIRIARASLISPAVVLQPASRMPVLGIIVGPVNDPAFGVPLVLSIERDGISGAEIRNSCS